MSDDDDDRGKVYDAWVDFQILKAAGLNPTQIVHIAKIKGLPHVSEPKLSRLFKFKCGDADYTGLNLIRIEELFRTGSGVAIEVQLSVRALLIAAVALKEALASGDQEAIDDAKERMSDALEDAKGVLAIGEERLRREAVSYEDPQQVRDRLLDNGHLEYL